MSECVATILLPTTEHAHQAVVIGEIPLVRPVHHGDATEFPIIFSHLFVSIGPVPDRTYTEFSEKNRGRSAKEANGAILSR
jgi:hypothetical protein